MRNKDPIRRWNSDLKAKSMFRITAPYWKKNQFVENVFIQLSIQYNLQGTEVLQIQMNNIYFTDTNGY